MRRFLARVVHNWPLKLAAIGLATLMYGGLVLSESTQTFNGDIPVVPKGQPADTFLLTAPPPVTLIRYFAPAGVPVTTSSFAAGVDLSSVDPEAGTVSVRIEVSSPDSRIRVLGYEPQFMSVQLDPIDQKSVPVQVERGTVPPGLDLGDTAVDPPDVIVSGPQSAVRQVVAVRADVQIQPSGIDVDQDVQLVPVDGVGNAVRTIDVTPSTARVTIPVFSDRQTRTLPVDPVLTGVPAAGFEVAGVTVDPQVVLIEGDADQLAQLVSIETNPIPLIGVSANTTVEAQLALPTGIVAVGNDAIRVSIKIRQVTETRSFSAGLRLVGTRRDLTYDFTTARVIVTIGGSSADLDRLAGSDLVVDLDVSGLGPGTVDIPVSIDLPTGPTLVAANPTAVSVTITATASPSPSTRPDAVGVGRLRPMARLFGTDGIRGVANVDLKPTTAYALGRAVAHRLVGQGGSMVVGQDTRRSGDMFVSAIAAGASSLGSDVHVVGVVPTPALAYLAGVGEFTAGIMVSASHNPADDNGLKVLDSHGLKLDDSVEDELEQLIWRSEELGGPGNAEIGRMIDARARLDDYLRHRLGLASGVPAAGLRLVLDGANGSGCFVGPEILAATGATVSVIHADPDGVNINVRAGATAPASLAEAVVAAGADVGFALDGDADRLIAVDAAGSVVDGDQVLGILALDRLERGRLPGGALVVSVLSNGGLQTAVEAAGGRIVRTPVGDKYILEGMQVAGAGLGGEKSGHVIVLEHTTSGDGIVTALEVLRVMCRRGASLAELAAAIPMLPQQQRAVKARHKDQWEGDRALQEAIAAATDRLGESGRVLVRPSGTEPALRVMVEGPDEALVAELADSLAALAGERLN